MVTDDQRCIAVLDNVTLQVSNEIDGRSFVITEGTEFVTVEWNELDAVKC